eukprot:1580940-Prymnesium_polylepis.1
MFSVLACAWAPPVLRAPGDGGEGPACGHYGLSLVGAGPLPVSGCGGYHAGHCGGSTGWVGG